VSVREALDAALALAGAPSVTVVYGGTPALVRQIQQGLTADAIITADEDWMDRLQAPGRLVPGSRITLIRNRLALIAPATSRLPVAAESAALTASLREALSNGRMAVADLQTVPAGRYAKAALQRRLAPTDNVRAALRLVSRGEAVLGIVYQTDALSDPGVRVLHVFAPDFHPEIRLPVAALAAGRVEAAQGLIRWLVSGPAQAEFLRRGFLKP
jgi:molybdate transport system substrate-binding protein